MGHVYPRKYHEILRLPAEFPNKPIQNFDMVEVVFKAAHIPNIFPMRWGAKELFRVSQPSHPYELIVIIYNPYIIHYYDTHGYILSIVDGM